ncbi:hypothetical protein LCM19_03080 [Qipengyuania flava]|nr:hypothetical protein [Qipengyuania flava]
MTERRSIRRTLELARTVAFPILAGLLIFWWHDAPAHYAWINIAAFLIGLLAIHFGRPAGSLASARLLCGLAIALLALPLVTGPQLDGVSRWLPIGPLTLNSGLLAIPLLALAALRDGKLGWAFLAAALLMASLQPDAAAVLALAAAAGAWMLVHETRWGLAVTGAAIGVGSFLLEQPSPSPVPFVEYLVPMLWHEMGVPTQAIGLVVLLLAPLFYLLRSEAALTSDRRAIALVYGAFLGSSFLAPYPVPLAGYGASAIIGLMAALGCMRDSSAQIATEDQLA